MDILGGPLFCLSHQLTVCSIQPLGWKPVQLGGHLQEKQLKITLGTGLEGAAPKGS